MIKKGQFGSEIDMFANNEWLDIQQEWEIKGPRKEHEKGTMRIGL